MTAIVLDTETTGFADEDRVLELAIADFDTGAIIFHEFFYPGIPIPPKIQEITKITDEMVANRPVFSAFSSEIVGIISTAEVVIGYNPSFDKRMIDNELRRFGIQIDWPLLVDAKRLWDVYEPRPERNLTNAYKRFVDLKGFDGAHGARADTIATLEVIRGQRAEFKLEETAWIDLDPERRTWWGPSHHVTIIEGVLTVNFGKHASRPVVEVDVGFWRWVSGKDFPPHVLLISMKMIEFGEKITKDELSRRLHTWAELYANKHF